MKHTTKKKIQGSISVLLVIILLPMMTFSALIVDMSRINMAKQMMSSAGDLTLNTALANYDTILKDVYGLFAMSQANGMNNDQLGEELNKYFAQTLSSYGVVSEEESDDYVAALIGDFRDILNEGTIDTTNFLELENITLNATMLDKSSLAETSVLRKQIVEYMKYRAPLGVGVDFLESLTAFEKMEDQNTVVEAQVKAQESTQDVTKACQKLIQLIRDYDKRVEELDDTGLTGVNSSTDSTVIPLEDYDSHVMKYLASWGENYTHINKLNLVFLVNSPSVDGVYLKSLAYGSQFYVKADGTVYSGANTGINVSPSLADDTEAAEQQVTQQITNLNNNYKKYVSQYAQSMLPENLLTLHSNNYRNATISPANENAAISSFIQFEKFLLDQAGNGKINYSQVKAVLEQIAILDKYRANYEQKINADITEAEDEQQEAQSAYDAIISARSSAANTMVQQVTKINSSTEDFVSSYESLDEAVAFLSVLGSQKQTEIKGLLDELPACTGSYQSYYNNNLKSGDWDDYGEYFQWLIYNSSFGTSGSPAQKAIISAAKTYVANNGYDADDFRSYMQSKLSDAEESEALFALLSCLHSCHRYATKYQDEIPAYNEANGKVADAQAALNAATNEVNRLKNEKTSILNQVKGCLQGYFKFCANYQADAYYYNHYITAAKNTVDAEAKAIQKHFTQLLANLKELMDDLEEISNQIGSVKTAIITYNQNLDAWNQANNTYKSNNGGDSFSSQTGEDIEKARTEYDEDLYDTLDTFVIAMWNEFDDLYAKLTETTNFTYGSKRIDAIGGVQDVMDAVSGTTFSDVVTVEEATTKLTSLYKGETVEYNPYTMDYTEPKQLAFLAPQVIQIQALKYLNSAYPDESLLSEEDKTANTTQKEQYETAKDQLTGQAPATGSGESGGGSGTGDEASGDFGYTYGSNSLLGDLPSQLITTDNKEVSDSQYLAQESGEGEDARLNASSGVGTQSDNISSVLSGIGNIATTAVENLYVLNYIFENFSYNTVIQDQVMKDNPATQNTMLGKISAADGYFQNADIMSAAKKNVTTLSNYPISSKNNYLFGGEIEYILFGNNSPAKNVTYAKASIYAIRFGFNCIYAFTNAEIRNATMAAGLAVQAATLGVVPYQVVQIVLQLALAAAESAIDLSAMDRGLSVAVIKTRDTWSLGVTGGTKALEDAANAAAQMVAETATDLANRGITSITNGLNDLVNAGADELKEVLYELSDNMEGAAKGVLQSVVDNVMTAVMADIEEGLNKLPYVGTGEGQERLPTKAEVRAEAVALFQNVRNKISTIISDACGGNEMALTLVSSLEKTATDIVKAMEDKVLGAIDSVGEDVDITEYVTQQLNDFKMYLIEQGNLSIGAMLNTVENKASEAISSANEQIQEYIGQCGENLTEEAAEAIKKEVQGFTDDFVKNTLEIPGSTSASDLKASPISMFQFGYKDYLMVLTYISICCGDSVLARTADVIQMNLQSAGADADFTHTANSGESKFLMSKAYTYVSISATADLDMFFLDLDLFANQLRGEDAGEVSPEEESVTAITYQGILGY